MDDGQSNPRSVAGFSTRGPGGAIMWFDHLPEIG